MKQIPSLFRRVLDHHNQDLFAAISRKGGSYIHETMTDSK